MPPQGQGIAIANYFTDYKARHGGMGFAYDQKWIGWEIANCQRLMAHWKNLFNNDIHVVDYEDLVKRPRPVVKNLMNYLGLDWEEKMLSFSTLNRPVKTASAAQVRQPLYTDSRNRWQCYKQILTPMFDALAERMAIKPPAPMRMGEHEPGLFLMGMALLTAGKNRQAERGFKKILEYNPEHAAAMHMLGAVYFNQGKILSARKYMARFIRRHPGNSTWYDNLPILLEQAGQQKTANLYRNKGQKIGRQPQYVPGIHRK